jgi:hypothetical protein
MKANPGGTITGDAILGRENEIAEIWGKLEKKSVLLSSERRVGKTCVLRKMQEHPREGWVPIFTWVESVRHPIEFVGVMYSEADRLHVRSPKGVWLGRVRSIYQAIAGTEIAGWKLPTIQPHWKPLLAALVEDVVENTSNRVVLMVDEFPIMVWNIIHDHGGAMAMEFLDALREIRQKFEPSGRIRFLLSGSIGLHLILQHLRAVYAYKNNPTNNMFPKVLSGLSMEDTNLMCRKYLDEEGIRRNNPSEFDQRMFQATDGLPPYIQYVCEKFQDTHKEEVNPEDIDAALREMMDSPEVEWFRNAADRLNTYYAELRASHQAFCILGKLCHQEGFVGEKEIIDYLRSQMVIEHDETVLSVLELLRDDNYIVRDTSSGERRYRFRYGLMRRWWEINKG